MGKLTVKKVLLDPGSSADVLFYLTFQKMYLSDKALQPSTGELVGFSGEREPMLGYVWLKTTLREPPYLKIIDIQFLVVNCASSYNVILGRPSLNSFGAIVFTIYLCVKFHVQGNIVTTIHADHKEARQCYNVGLKLKPPEPVQRINSVYNAKDIPSLAELDPRDDMSHRPTPTDELKKVQLTEQENQYTNIGFVFSIDCEQNIINLLKSNSDLFSWTPADMPDIDPAIVCHKLAVNPNARLVRQKKGI
ncbi:uncharacterized protein [Arachis hypogaea]|uniref:uncharacterized protein n=1 Tax=Arachis hypogaea TaxID=3818 RepID=UPI003B2227AE